MKEKNRERISPREHTCVGRTAEVRSSPRLCDPICDRVLPYALWPLRTHDAWPVHDAHGPYAHDARLSRDCRPYGVWRLPCDAARRAHAVPLRARDALQLWSTWETALKRVLPTQDRLCPSQCSGTTVSLV